jgi:hypothetical protein
MKKIENKKNVKVKIQNIQDKMMDLNNYAASQATLSLRKLLVEKQIDGIDVNELCKDFSKLLLSNNSTNISSDDIKIKGKHKTSKKNIDESKKCKALNKQKKRCGNVRKKDNDNFCNRHFIMNEKGEEVHLFQQIEENLEIDSMSLISEDNQDISDLQNEINRNEYKKEEEIESDGGSSGSYNSEEDIRCEE